MGTLDGKTVLRYAHAYEGGGGVEQHLADLNRALGSRNSFRTVQVQLTRDPGRCRSHEQKVGKSELLTVPLLVSPPGESVASASRSAIKFSSEEFRSQVLDLVVRTRKVNHFLATTILAHRPIPKRPGEPDIEGELISDLIEAHRIDLVVLHTSGGADASAVIECARQAHCPVLLIHHFANYRLGSVSVRQQIDRVDAVAGASRIGVPRFLRDHFVNLSDAVDTEFFDRTKARPVAAERGGAVLYAPARVTREKGQADVIQVARLLDRRGLPVRVVFAGRIDDPVFAEELRQTASREGLAGRVRFLGALSMEEYRDWYLPATVMILPTRHHEGMPRTVIDAQSMLVPPVVYDVGGTSEGLVAGETGMLIPAGDVEGMADAVELLIRSEPERARLARNGRLFVEERFSMPAFAERHENLYGRLMRGIRAQ